MAGSLLALLVASCTRGPDATARRHFHDESGISFDHPARWALHDAYASFTGGSVIAILGTLAIPSRCGEEHVDINCYYEQVLAPGAISIVVGTGSFGGATLFDEREHSALEIGREQVEIAGLPAIVHRYGPGGYYEQDEAIGWEIAFPTSVLSAYGIEARMRGPGLEEMRAQLNDLIASIHVDGLGPPIGEDPRAANAPVAAALAELDRRMRRSWVARPQHVSWYACFPHAPGVTERRVITLGPNGPLDALRAIECRYTVARESGRLWRVTLELNAGAYTETLWLTGDGTIAGSRHQGVPPS